MRKAARRFVATTSSIAAFWFFYRACNATAKILTEIGKSLTSLYVHALRSRLSSDSYTPKIRELFPGLTVAHGPFAGMKYPTVKAAGSVILPKLLGSYESELHAVLDDILAKEYTHIVDIGCAEGYYAIGLGMRLPHTTIYAFDTDDDARKLCQELATLNGVLGRLRLDGFCNEAALLNLDLGSRALIISDCEGYERELFTPEVVGALSRHDVLVETHDFLDAGVSSLLKERFAATHSIVTVQSMDDTAKARTYEYPELIGYDVVTRQEYVREGRPGIMEWLYMTPKRGI